MGDCMKRQLFQFTSRGAQSGQAIVLIALMMVGLLGVTGLAIDGGSLLLLQREAQKVADIAAMSASIAMCSSGGDPEEAAKSVAEVNGVDPDAVTVTELNDNDLEVVVRLPKDPFFIQVVYQGDMVAQGRAVTRCSTSESAYSGYLLMGLSEVCNMTVQVTTSSAYLNGAIWSNNDVGLQAGNSTLTGQAEVAEMPTNLTNNSYIANWWIGGNAPVNNLNAVPIITPQNPDPLFNIEDYRPGGAKALEAGDDYYVLEPSGSYLYTDPANGISASNGSTWYSFGAASGSTYVPREGLIYVPGDFGGSGGGGPLGDNYTSGERGVTIVAEGAMNFSTGGQVSIEAYMDGLAIFSNKYNTAGAHTSNSSNNCSQGLTHMGTGIGSFWRGLIYAPGGLAQITTSNTQSFHGAVIANVVQIQVGSARLDYEGGHVPPGDPSLYYLE